MSPAPIKKDTSKQKPEKTKDIKDEQNKKV